jgi:choline dehydrogenase
VEETFDYVIVGAGSAGCVLADRLTEDGRYSVLLLEYGGSDRSVYIQMPSALSIPMNMAKYDWRYESEPEPHLGARRLHTPRGKVLGGSSSINGLVYVRGNALDYEHWEAQGATGWGYRQLLPYFRRAERRADGADTYRGGAGKLHTRYGALTNPLHQAWLTAARNAGYPLTADINGFQQEGFGRLDMTVGGAAAPPTLTCARRWAVTAWRCARMRSPPGSCSTAGGQAGYVTGVLAPSIWRRRAAK